MRYDAVRYAEGDQVGERAKKWRRAEHVVIVGSNQSGERESFRWCGRRRRPGAPWPQESGNLCRCRKAFAGFRVACNVVIELRSNFRRQIRRNGRAVLVSLLKRMLVAREMSTYLAWTRATARRRDESGKERDWSFFFFTARPAFPQSVGAY